MSTEKTTGKRWTTKDIEEIFINAGLTPKRLNKTGSCIMPAPKNWPHAKRQEDSTT